MEGVMMRNGEKYAVAVRTVDGKIAVKSDIYHSIVPAAKVAKIPIIRGVFNFIDSLVLGMTSLMYSAEFFAEETPEELEERLKDERKKAEKKAARLKSAGKAAEADDLLRQQEEKAAAEREKLAGRVSSETPGETLVS